MYYLSLLLNSDLQSWGTTSYKQIRKTNMFPTQSAITGILCRATGNYINEVGVDGFENFLNQVNKGKFYSILFDYDTVEKDYQTIGTNYNHKQNPYKLFKAKGTVHNETIIVNKYYLTNAWSACIIEHNDKDFLYYLKESLLRPKSIPFLGRACCIPNSQIFNSIKSNYKEAFISLLKSVNEKRDEDKKISEHNFVKVVSPNKEGRIIADVMIGYERYINRLIKEEDKPLKAWLK